MAGDPICIYCRRPMVLVKFRTTSAGDAVCEDCDDECKRCGAHADSELFKNICQCCEQWAVAQFTTHPLQPASCRDLEDAHVN